MPRLPQIVEAPQSRDVTDAFYGYNHKLKIRAGEFFDTENLTTADFPMLATRKRRSRAGSLFKAQGLLAKDQLVYVDDGELVYGGKTVMTGLSAGEKQLVNFGSYIVVFPDKVYYNTKDPADSGSMEEHLTLNVTADYTLCTVTGADLTYTSGTSAPANPTNGQYWHDTKNKALKCWSESQAEWVEVVTVYTKIKFYYPDYDLRLRLKEHDGVSIRGTAFPSVLDGDKVIYAVGADWLVIVGLIPNAASGQQTYVTVNRTVPDLNYVIECQNRLWGCFYGKAPDGKFLNEIYCSALGDFKNWRQYMGVSTDSWTASVGSDGPWTGAINFLGAPTFFKENKIHRVSVSSYGGHRIDETTCRGVQEGCAKSLAVVNELLIYKSRADVCAFQGGIPEGLSTALGDEQYTDAVAGVFGSRYYISMKDAGGRWHLFVFNANNNLWIREDSMHVTSFAAIGDSFYAVDADGTLWDLAGVDGEKETSLQWMAQSGVLYYELPNKKRTSRYDIMLTATKGSHVSAFIQYDSDGIWRFQGRIVFSGLGSVTFPVRPRRCNHMELRLEGTGDAKLYSIARILEQGSDV